MWSPEVLVSPTQSIDNIAVTLHKVVIKGKMNMNIGTQIAQV